MKEKIIIIGGGQAAANAINAIRNADNEVSLSLISSENYLPYERPPLSKEYISGEKNFEDFVFFNQKFYKENNIELKLQSIVEQINFNDSKLKIFNKQDVYYDKLLICTGSRNRLLKIQGLESSDIFQLRDIVDGKKILEKAKKIKHISIIGGGFIGLEIASSLSKFNKKIVVIENAKQLMGRSIPLEIAELMLNKHKENGIDIYLKNNVNFAEKFNDKYLLKLNDHQKIETEMIIAGIGVEPEIELLKKTNIELNNGIITDQFCQTSITNVFAAGDVCNFYHPFYKKYIRLESWKHAQDHGIIAGLNMIGEKKIYDQIPWMWSNQYDLNIQLAGITDDYDNVLKRGSNIDDGIIFFYLKENKIKGVCGIGKFGKISKDIKLASILSKKEKEIDIEKLSDKNQKLQKL